jgi:large subunit ribosomal protein L22
MTGPKTNERPGTKAVLRHFHMSASKARQVLNLIRGEDVDRAAEILNGVEREAGRVIAKVLASAVANAVHNDGQQPEDLYVAACYADEGTTMKRWRPRARGRATRIRKRACHITIVVARMDEERLERRAVSRQASGAQRARRVAESQRRADQQGRGRRRDAERAAAAEEEVVDDEVVETEAVVETEEIVEAPEAAEVTEVTEAEGAEDDVVAEAVTDEASAEDETQEKGE